MVNKFIMLINLYKIIILCDIVMCLKTADRMVNLVKEHQYLSK
jgi:hypothetical protein